MRSILMLTIAATLPAHASELLREFDFAFTFPSSTSNADSESFFFSSNNTVLSTSPFIQSPCLGCGITFALGFTGSIDFDSANSPDFAAVAAAMTDGLNQSSVTGWLENRSGTPFTGGNISIPDNIWLGAPDLAGLITSIDFIRLNITQDDISNPAVLPFAGNVQVWGTASGTLPPVGPPPATAPEPRFSWIGMLVLLGGLFPARRHVT